MNTEMALDDLGGGVLAALFLFSFLMSLLSGCSSDERTVSVVDAKGDSFAIRGDSGKADELAKDGAAGATSEVGFEISGGTEGTGGTSGTPIDAGTTDSGGSTGNAGAPDGAGGAAGEVGGTGGTAGAGGAGGTFTGDPSCRNVPELTDCTSPKHWKAGGGPTGSIQEVGPDQPANIQLKGRCVKGICCSGCVLNGVCVPLSPNGDLVLPEGQVNGCGKNADACFDCNSRETMRTCSYLVQRNPNPTGTSSIARAVCID